MRKTILILIILLYKTFTFCQSAWPSKTWANATNLSSLLPSAVEELSGLHWNNDLKRLFAIGDQGYFVALQFNTSTGQFTLLGSAKNSDGSEGITQANTSGNEFYTIDEKNYEIRKYTFNSSFTSVTKLNSWNLLLSPSPMTNTENSGPEGICFVPDYYLQKAGFVSSATGLAYTSKKGMGGLMFLAHQDGGYVWVFDVNPSVNNDFAFVGKYRTNRSESCDLAFDKSTGLLYILHNIDDNYLEVSDLRTAVSGGMYTLTTLKEYFIPNPSGTENIEGFAIAPKYPQTSTLGAWLCRDVTKSSEVADALRWFNPFTADGSDIQTDIINTIDFSNNIFVTTSKQFIRFSEVPTSEICIYSIEGKCIQRHEPTLEIKHNFKSGIYILKANYKTTKIIIH